MNWPKVMPDLCDPPSVTLTGNDHKQMVFWKLLHAGIMSPAKQTQEQTHLISRIPPARLPRPAFCTAGTLIKLRRKPGPLRVSPSKSLVETCGL